jgi:hypothetical protein
MKKICALFFILLINYSNGQTAPKKGTAFDSTHLTIVNNINSQPSKSNLDKADYMELMEKMLEQKQAFYDSSLNTLNFWGTIIGCFIAFITLGFAIMVFIGYTKIADIKTEIEEQLEVKMKKIATDKYEADISDFNNRISALESGEKKENNTPYERNQNAKNKKDPF